MKTRWRPKRKIQILTGSYVPDQGKFKLGDFSATVTAFGLEGDPDAPLRLVRVSLEIPARVSRTETHRHELMYKFEIPVLQP